MFEVMIQKNPIAQLPAYFLYQVSGMRYSKSKIYRIGIVLSSVALISWFAIILSYVVPFVDSYGKYLSDKKLVEANADGVNWTWQRSLSWKDHTYYLNPLDPTINQKTKRILAQQADDLKEDAGLLILIFLSPVLIVLLGKILQWINGENSEAQDVNNSNSPLVKTTISKYYHIIIDGKQSQPYSFEQLKAMHIREDDLVWHKGLTNWKPAKDISDLRDVIFYMPPPIITKKPNDPNTKDNGVFSKREYYIGISILVFLVFGTIMWFWGIQNNFYNNIYKSEAADLVMATNTSGELEFNKAIQLLSLTNKTIASEDSALELLHLSSNLGYEKANIELGKLYQKRENYANALKYYQKACDQSLEFGCHQAGWILQFGLGVKQDLERALIFYRRSIELNGSSAPTSYSNMGYYYLQNQKYDQAFGFFTEAARKGYLPAYTLLGQMYEKGNHVAKDNAAAFENYKLALPVNWQQSSKPLDCLYYVANCFEKGIGVNKNLDSAIFYYKEFSKRNPKDIDAQKGIKRALKAKDLEFLRSGKRKPRTFQEALETF